MEDQNEQAQPDYQSIREQALAALLPIVGSLDEAPERQFELLMTAVRTGAGGPQLLGQALQAAIKIEAPTSKAEALIDVANEARYQLEN